MVETLLPRGKRLEMTPKSQTSQVLVLSDGHYKQDGGMFYGGAPRAVWNEWRHADRMHRVVVPINTMLVRVGDETILVDPGMGSWFNSEIQEFYGRAQGRRLARSLREHGVRPRDVTTVVLTHTHFEHAGALLDRTSYRLGPMFPKARIVVQADALADAAGSAARAYGPFEARAWLNELDGRFYPVHGHDEICAGVELLPAEGHSPGHQLVKVNTGAGRFVFTGDLAPTPEHLLFGVTSADDRSAEDVLVQRRQLMQWAQDGWQLVFPHALGAVAGVFQEAGAGWHFKPTREISAGKSSGIDWTRLSARRDSAFAPV